VELSRRFDRLDQRTQEIVTALSKRQEFVEYLPDDSNLVSGRLQKLDAQIVALSQLLNRTEIVVVDNEKRASIIDAVYPPPVSFDEGALSQQDIILLNSDEAQLRRVAEDAVLENFRFLTMSDRREEVAEAHHATFEWIFRKSSSTKPCLQGSFLDWLRSGDGIYWINGKAGSGKSTLMRFIYDNPRTMQELSLWSNTASKAGFFFWNSGSREQRSHSGLLRSLIVEVLEKHRALIPIIFPWQWAHNYTQALHKSTRFFIKKWPYAKLLSIFQRVIDQDIVPLKVCIFIDGLDEYDDDKRKIADFVVKLSMSTKLKLCVSSRPLLEFGDAFHGSPSLRLQDLTLTDIQQYVSDNFSTNYHYRHLTMTEPIKAPELVEEIVLKADGVFLWVKLVVHSLLDGLGNRDTISDLRRRLHALPGDLEDLYSHMLSCIHPFYLGHASRLFQIVRAAQEQGRDIGHLDDEAMPLTTIALSLAVDEDSNLFMTTPILAMRSKEILTRCQLMEDRLKSQSAGLLEILGSDGHGIRNTDAKRANGKVQFLHRTVRDYLAQDPIWSKQLDQTKGSDFSPHIALVRSYIIQLKAIVPSWLRERLLKAALIAMEYAYHADLLTKNANVALLDELDRTMASHAESWYDIDYWTNLRTTKSPFGYETFFSLAVSYGLCAYVGAKLGNGYVTRTKFEKRRPLLDYAVK
jgi:hypothetical protein